jgi:hypothetical protein
MSVYGYVNFEISKLPFVVRTYSSRGHPSSLRAVPISISDSPLASNIFHQSKSQVENLTSTYKLQQYRRCCNRTCQAQSAYTFSYIKRGRYLLDILPGSLETLLDNLALLCTTVCEPSTEGEDGDLETGRTKVAEGHVLEGEEALC